MSKDYRTIPAEEVMARFPPARQARIDLRAAQLIAEEIGLGELRRARRLTQSQLAKRIGGKQVYVSRFERRSDVRLSKLRRYVEALGGNLELLVTFPDRSTYRLSSLGGSGAALLPRRQPRGKVAKKPARQARPA